MIRQLHERKRDTLMTDEPQYAMKVVNPRAHGANTSCEVNFIGFIFYRLRSILSQPLIFIKDYRHKTARMRCPVLRPAVAPLATPIVAAS